MQKVTQLIIFLLTIYCSATAAPNKKISTDPLDLVITKAIEDKFFPGAQIVVGNKEGVIFSKSYGYMDYSSADKVQSETLYDLASCTKALATTLAIMKLVDADSISLETPICELIELSDTLEFRDVKVKELLYHTAGFLPGVAISTALVKPLDQEVSLFTRRMSETNPYIYDTSYYVAKDIVYDSTYINHCGGDNYTKLADELYLDRSFNIKLDSMIMAAYRPAQRGVHRYSDLNFYLLQKVIENKSLMSLDNYIETIYDEMKLSNIGFKPLEWSDSSNICPTEYDVLIRRDTIRGIVHDDLACVQGGVGGNSGLFGSANSVAQICGMFLRGGLDYNDKRIVDSMTIANFTQIKRSPTSKKSVYSLGFTKIDSEDRPYTPQSYGHSGYTGTYFWIDPLKDIYVVMLTNRVHPTRTNKNFNPEYRAKIWELITSIFVDNYTLMDR